MAGYTSVTSICILSLTIGLFTKSVAAQCDAPLGFEDGNITDSQLTATSAYGTYTADQARLNVGRGWSGGSSNDHYLQVDLLTQHQVTRYSIQGSKIGWYSRTVALFYSQDKLVWERYIGSDGRDTLEGNTDYNTVRSYDLSPPVQARYLVFQPLSKLGYPSLRLELFGCEADQPVPARYTVVTQDIEDTQEWLPSLSPYVLNSLIYVRPSGHVKIQPGVKVIFNTSDAGFLVLGTLETNGLTGLPVMFSMAQPGFSKPNLWVGIEVVTQGNLTLEHCDIHGAATGIKGPLSSITVRHCHIHHNSIGVDLSMGDTDPGRTQFVGAQIMDNTHQGIYGRIWNKEQNYISLRDCIIIRNRNHAMKFDREVVIVADNCEFSHSQYGIYNYYYGISLTMRKCRVMDNSQVGFYLNYARRFHTFHINIDDSLFRDNRIDAIKLNVHNVPKGSNLTITNSNFTNNGQEAIEFYWEYFNSEISVIIKSNIFVSSQSRSNYLIYMGTYRNRVNTSVSIDSNAFFTRQALRLVGGYLVGYDIVNNTFSGLTGTEAITIGGGNIMIADNHFTNCTTFSVINTQALNTHIADNIFINPEATYDVLLSVPYKEDIRMDVTKNFWGGSDKIYVRSRVCDFFCDLYKIMAEIHPFYTTDSLSELSTEDGSDLFSFPSSDRGGGILTESVTLGPHQYLLIDRSLYVPEEYKLTILENVTLVFPYKQGIFVRGLVDIQGSEVGKVVLTSERTDVTNWGGLILNSTGSTMKHMLVRKAQAGVSLSINITGAILVSDSIITQSGSAVAGQVWTDVTVSLHRVKINETSKTLNLQKMNGNSVIIDFVQCDVSGETYLHSSVREGLFNVSISSTNFTGGRTFRIQSCYNIIILQIQNSTFTSPSGYSFDVNGGLFDVQIRNMSSSGYGGLVSFWACSRSTKEHGTIDIRDSSFYTSGYSNALHLQGYSYISHNILLVNNTFYTSRNYAGVYTNVRQYTTPWTILIQGNKFNKSGIELYGSFSNTTIEENTFEDASSALKTQIQCIVNSTITLRRNEVHGGTVTLYSLRPEDAFDVQENVFNASVIILKNPITVMHQNSFMIQSEFYVKFEGSGHANKAINCTFNYWGTTDHNLIDRRLLDSAYDENLPTINVIPFYGFPNLTNLQYPDESFLASDGTVGGRVGGSVTLTPIGSPYTVTANIIVGKLETLIVEAGVTLLFPKGIGIYVEGSFIVQGNISHPVEAKSMTVEEKWAGVKLRGHIYRPSAFPSPNIRLMGGEDDREGRVEMRINGTWGTVCDDWFDQRDAKVVCRMLGFDPTVTHEVYYSAKFGQGTGPILRGNLQCSGFEETLDRCKHSSFRCVHQEDAGVRCVGNMLTTPEETGNEVQLHYFNLNDTEEGLEINGNVTSVDAVSSNHSNQNGITIHVGFKGMKTLDMQGVKASHNKKTGIAFASTQDDESYPDYFNMKISNCEIHSNREHGIHIRYNLNISIVDCRLHGNEDRAVFLQSLALLDISQSVFSENGRGVIGMNSYYNYRKRLQLSIKDSDIINHDMTSYRNRYQWYFYNSLFTIYTRSAADSTFLFSRNVFTGNIGEILNFDLYGNDLHHFIQIDNNTFNNNNASLLTLTPPRLKPIQFLFVSNIIDNNTVPDFREPLLKLKHQINSNGSRVNISQNLFLKNIAPQMVKLMDIRKVETNTSITNNIFRNNNCSETIKTSVFDFQLKDNIFSNPLSRCDLETPPFERWYDIDARWNYWGGQDISHVFSKICGFDSDMGRSFVSYLPFYLSEDLGSVSSDVQTDFWIGNLHGGVVDGYLHLMKDRSPYHITRSIYIRENGFLEIDKGVEIQFHQNTGIYVDGLLVAGGSSERVKMSRASKMSWYGVVFPFKTAGVSKTVRLVNGSRPNEGRVEVFVNGSWSTICNMDQKDAILLCQALGYGSREVKRENSGFGGGIGPILYSLQCDDMMTSLSQCQPTLKNNRYCVHSRDYGVTCNEFVALTGTNKFSYLEDVSILGSREGLLIQTPTVKLSNCDINNTEKTGLTLDTDAIDLDLNGTVVEHGQSDGILVKVSKGLRILNGTTQHNKGNGMELVGAFNLVVIEKMVFRNNTENGLKTVESYPSKNKKVVVRDNVFKDHVLKGFGLKFITRFDPYKDQIVNIENNKFINNLAGSLDMPLVGNGHYTEQRNVYITGNQFLSSGHVSIYLPSFISAYIEDNIATNCTGGSNCFFTINIKNYKDQLNHNVSVSTNSFEKTQGKCAVLLTSSDYNFSGTFSYNQIFSSSTKDAAIILESKRFTLYNNILDNPSADYELKVDKTGSDEIKAEHNWWGTTDPVTAGDRILHKQQDQRLLTVDYLPILTDQQFDCSGVANCSRKGECVRPNGCRCDSGWAGADCSDFDCSRVGNCNKNGDCIGPNQCNCSLGWEGESCVLATCHEVGDCSGDQRGYCVLPNRCTCFPQYSGEDCSQCAALRWGKSCLPCPRCEHGDCNTTNGRCECESENWSGELCNKCSETFYGPKCLPYINVLNIIPSSGPDTGDVDVHIWGHNFPETIGDIFYCKFDRTIVNGTLLSKEHVVCKTPQHTKGEVIVEISSDGQQFTSNKTTFTYYAVCPPDACGKTEIPPRGHCLYGGCVCTLPWSGKDCSVELKAPVFSLEPQKKVVDEGDEYQIQPSLTEGSSPIDWRLYGAPSGMTINQRTGLIYWERTVASVQAYKITVKASNRIGFSEVLMMLTVPLSYNVTIDEISPSGSLPAPKSVQINGHVNFFTESTPSLIAFVDVKIRNKGKITSTVTAVTSPNIPEKFEAVYSPKAGESGLFEVDGRHPSDSGFTPQRTWQVLGMKCIPVYTSRQAYLDTETVELQGVTVLRNEGIGTIRNITANVEGVGGPLKSAAVRINNFLSNNKSRPLIEKLEPNVEVSVDLILTASIPLSGTVGIVFSTAEGTMARMRVGLRLNVRRPVLITSVASLRDSIPRGTQKTFQINITNKGEVEATSLRVSLPSEPRIAISAFSTSRPQTSEHHLNLQPEETAILVLTVTTGSTDALGEFSGSVALNSDLASASISYRFYVTSLETMNVTVRVEDEFTYFASDKPLVTGAVVTLKNQLRGYNEQRITMNDTDFVVFEDVTEDRYTLQATAPGHSSYSAVIIAKPSDSSFSIFLQRVAVTYTWTVTPTTFEDKYIITLDSTFETHVPMPVVTVEPANINLIPYEEGKKDIINFNITNHGLIRGDNARFVIPKHPTLVFNQTIDPIGSVDANTSIIVPVQVKLKPRPTGNDTATPCGLKFLYDYFCGQTRTGGQDITLTRQYPGRPPLPCGSVGGGGGGGGGGYVGISGGESGPSRPSSSVIVYNPVTPLSCDCARTLIKDCLLGFHPFAGCALAIDGLSGNTGFVAKLMALLNFAFACIMTPLSPVCPLCGAAATLWQAGTCIAGVNSDCRHRSSNSEVVQQMTDSNAAMQNYLIIMKDIYGGEEMFNASDNSWMNSFNLALAEDSVAKQFLSQSEITSILAPLNTSHVPAVQKFLYRWNKTMTAWEDGTLATLGPEDDVISYNLVMTRSEQFRKDTEASKHRGFDSIFDDFNNAVTVYQEKEKRGDTDEGVCAKVRVRIVQELVLTRDAFNARLEIENGEQSALENIIVTVNIRPTYGDRKFTNDLFSVGTPVLVGITAVDGSGRLEKDISGTAEWLIIPYSSAAVKEDTLYDVGGTLAYTVGGSNFSISLLPDTITVKPKPSLILNYFHEKYVQGDDPMTTDITEPVVPFTLAVMVSNGAYGVARQLKITSAQPEIVENEKGLLVSFKIIGAQLGTDPVTPSLSINFGDIESFETKTARWLLTSSLKGKFYNFTATFENINPLGDPQLSIMERIEYHPLIHLVRLESVNDDLDDFLVDDVIDGEDIPDAVYDSSNGFLTAPVDEAVVTEFVLHRTDTVGNRIYTYINLSVTLANTTSVYFYTRVVNNVTRDSISESLLQVTRDDGTHIRVGKNAWQTSYYHNRHYLHVFDFKGNVSSFISYSLVIGPQNIYNPKFLKDIYNIQISKSHTPGHISYIEATDKDPSSKLQYMLENHTSFTIDAENAELRSTVTLEIGTYELHVTVTDDGVPPLSSSIKVTINVTENKNSTVSPSATLYSSFSSATPSVITTVPSVSAVSPSVSAIAISPSLSTISPSLSTISPSVSAVSPSVSAIAISRPVSTISPSVSTISPSLSTISPSISTISPSISTISPSVSTMSNDSTISPSVSTMSNDSTISPYVSTMSPVNTISPYVSTISPSVSTTSLSPTTSSSGTTSPSSGANLSQLQLLPFRLHLQLLTANKQLQLLQTNSQQQIIPFHFEEQRLLFHFQVRYANPQLWISTSMLQLHVSEARMQVQLVGVGQQQPLLPHTLQIQFLPARLQLQLIPNRLQQLLQSLPAHQYLHVLPSRLQLQMLPVRLPFEALKDNIQLKFVQTHLQLRLLESQSMPDRFTLQLLPSRLLIQILPSCVDSQLSPVYLQLQLLPAHLDFVVRSKLQILQPPRQPAIPFPQFQYPPLFNNSYQHPST